MQKLLSMLLIIVLLIVGGVLFLRDRYQAIGTGAGDLIVFDRLKGTFIQKNSKGEWEEQNVKAGEIFIDFESKGKEREKGGDKAPAVKPDVKI